VEQDEHEGSFGPFVGEAVAVAASDAFHQPVGFHLAKVVAELGEGVGADGQAEGAEEGLVNIGAAPSVELRAPMEQDLHQSHHPGVVNLDAGDFRFTDLNRQSNPLKEREVDVNV